VQSTDAGEQAGEGRVGRHVAKPRGARGEDGPLRSRKCPRHNPPPCHPGRARSTISRSASGGHTHLRVDARVVLFGRMGLPRQPRCAVRKGRRLLPPQRAWSTIPILICGGLFNLVGVRYYWLYALPLIIAALGAAHLLWRSLLRHNVDPWLRDPLGREFHGARCGWQDLIWAFQIGFVGSLAFVCSRSTPLSVRNGTYPPCGASAPSCARDFGVPMVIAAALVALAHRRSGWRSSRPSCRGRPLRSGGWRSAIRPHRRCSRTPLNSVVHMDGLTGHLAAYLDLPRVVGAVLIVCPRGHRRCGCGSTPAVLGASSIALFAFVGIGRLQDGAG